MKSTLVSLVCAVGIAVYMFASQVFADTGWVMVANSPDHSVQIQLYQDPCEGTPVGDMIGDPELLGSAKAGFVSVKGKRLAACWIEQEDMVAILMENGAQGALPKSEFSRADAS